MKFVKLISELRKTDVGIAGGKGASLGEMTNAGINVPGGFVVLSSAFDAFALGSDVEAEIEAALKGLDRNDVEAVELASEKLRAIITNTDVPAEIKAEIVAAHGKVDSKFVAVRSSATSEDSATAAWAGQLETYLNVTSKDIVDMVRRCWASLFTPRAIVYRLSKNIDGHISVAVVVQKMVESEVSGVAFSVHPVTMSDDQILIEACIGLGEMLVSGAITPDNYVFSKSSGQIIEENINTQSKAMVRDDGKNKVIELAEEKGSMRKISEPQLVDLARMVMKIEKHYGFPVDVEWAIHAGRLYILQSRPITTIK
ncbi:MAG: hypothetical protein KGH98_00375 [Candidatus Micrarchaeota archaeon]|nr:hypothetical protein [Candidatus Micrarchaeota archaeon]